MTYIYSTQCDALVEPALQKRAKLVGGLQR